jgi:NhaP-type Na+/H+ or K+/H+ antiporter
MVLFELIIALLLAGAAAAFVPGTPAITLEPGLALALFVAPVLLDAAFDASPRDLRDNWLPIGALAIVAVGLTVARLPWLRGCWCRTCPGRRRSAPSSRRPMPRPPRLC